MTDQEISTAAPDTSRLTEAELRTYRRALRGETLPDDEPGLAPLLAREVLLANTHQPGTYVPAPSRYLETQLTAAVLRALSGATEALAGIPAHVRELEAEQQRYHHSPSPVGTLLLRTVPEVNAETIRTIQAAEYEILTAQPGHRKPKVLKGALPRDLQAAQRGVTVRTIYRTSGRTNPTQREWVATMTRAGAQVRTLGEDFLRLIIVDRAHAFFEVYGEDGTVQQEAAWYTQDRGVCALLAAHFRQQWDRADPWVPGEGAGAPGTDDDTKTSKLQRTILRGIVAGRSHRQIGENLGLSERTVTAHVSKMREALGLETVPQLTFWWATSPERLLP
ncbi:LuxR C-terminal-related transcriptional regulator [Streptomyces sp. NPDC012794]|uniref:LuxR C-terminal-related transcriptional regulator n=1 Tax=Streptomyces sp. NPDC012794 TaxID=3364850 RepID=UPI0036CB147B